MTGTLVLENLKHRPMRSLLSLLLMGVPVTLILALVGLTQGMLQDARERQRGVGADVVVHGTAATSAVAFTGAPLPEGYVDVIEKQPHVKLAMGVLNHNIDLPLVIFGIDIKKFDQMNGGFTYLEGHTFQGPDDILVDRLYASQKHLHVGDAISLMGHNWHVAGIVESGKLARIAVPLATLQDLDAAHNHVTSIFVQADNPSNADLLAEELKKLIPDASVNTMADIVAMYSSNNIPGVKEFTLVIMVLGVIIGFLVVYLSMYMSVLQRTREIGILKSLGASKGFILAIIQIEAVVLAIGGTILGVIMSFGVWWLIRTLVPASIPMIIVPWWWPIAGAITLVGALLGALYPGLSAASHDPIEALAYE